MFVVSCRRGTDSSSDQTVPIRFVPLIFLFVVFCVVNLKSTLESELEGERLCANYAIFLLKFPAMEMKGSQIPKGVP